jgi:large subunit ribosomal protein L9
MKVLLRSDVVGVGRRGDIVEVRSGYARNFLLPTGAALKANETMEIQAA